MLRYNRAPWVEDLESRRLLSSVDVLGTFTGPIDTPNGNGTITFVFASESKRGVLKGQLTYNFGVSDTQTLSFQGSIKGNRVTLSSSGKTLNGTAVVVHHKEVFKGTGPANGGGTATFITTKT